MLCEANDAWECSDASRLAEQLSPLSSTNQWQSLSGKLCPDWLIRQTGGLLLLVYCCSVWRWGLK